MHEQLIELVSRHTILYDTNDPNYLKSKLKDELWNDIGKEVKLKSGNEAKTLWLKLLNCHRDALRRQKKFLRSGASAVAIKQWKYQKQMQFLVPYMPNRPREGNLEKDSEDGDRQQGESAAVPETEIFESEAETSDNRQDYEEFEFDDVVNEPSTSGTRRIQENKEEKLTKRKVSETEDRSINFTPVSKTKKKKEDDMQEVIKQSMIQRQKRAEERLIERTQKPEDDDLYHFFMSMYQITKKIPSKFQHLARKDVFQAVAKVEAAYLGIQNPTQQNDYHTERRAFPYTYVNTHTPHPHSSYSSTPLPSTSPNSRSSHHNEYQSYRSPATSLSNSSYPTVSTPLPPLSNTYDLQSDSSSPTTFTNYMPAATPLQPTTTGDSEASQPSSTNIAPTPVCNKPKASAFDLLFQSRGNADKEKITENNENIDDDAEHSEEMKKPKGNKIRSFVDILGKGEDKKIEDAIVRFFFGCNISLSVIDSDHFKNLIKVLRPAYANKLRGRKALSTTIIDNTYNQCRDAASNISANSVLLIDDWKNSAVVI
ncbi:unnamed protein product [Ceutorhynchus assimilis]|uniref:MADF domain-containing protein n=1 Tax=Ceutorhynchus assimilis TaxID=467358 RepID=A0A9N9QRC6_9CUCU|nr:unnamed protein product [Ceutorhynchus assimilis]